VTQREPTSELNPDIEEHLETVVKLEQELKQAADWMGLLMVRK
jgi:hypothetical protein